MATIVISTILLFLISGIMVSLLLSIVPDKERYDQSVASRFIENCTTFLLFRYGDAVVEQYPIYAILQARGEKTGLLISGTLFITLGFSIPLGLYAAHRKGFKRSRLAMGFIYASSAVPTLVWATLLLIFFQRSLNVFLHWQMLEIYSGPSRILIFLLPMLCLAVGDGMLADMTRHIRDEAAKLLEQDFVRALRARNIPIRRHLFRGLFPVIMSMIAGKIAYLFGGAIVVEYIFGWQGLGFALFGAISRSGSKDYPLILAATMLFITIALLVNLFGSVASLWADPRLGKE